MIRKDYQLLATALAIAASECRGSEIKGAEKCVEHVCHALKMDNPNFHEQLFVDYVKKEMRKNPCR